MKLPSWLSPQSVEQKTAEETPRCKATTQGYEWEGKHQCRWPAQANGFCKVHDPEKKHKRLKRRISKLREQLAAAENELKELENEQGRGTTEEAG